MLSPSTSADAPDTKLMTSPEGMAPTDTVDGTDESKVPSPAPGSTEIVEVGSSFRRPLASSVRRSSLASAPNRASAHRPVELETGMTSGGRNRPGPVVDENGDLVSGGAARPAQGDVGLTVSVCIPHRVLQTTSARRDLGRDYLGRFKCAIAVSLRDLQVATRATTDEVEMPVPRQIRSLDAAEVDRRVLDRILERVADGIERPSRCRGGCSRGRSPR